MPFPSATALIPAANYSPADVLLLDLRQPGELTDDLLAITEPVAGDGLMSILDEINARYG